VGGPLTLDSPLLRMSGICKDFPGVRALDHVDFELLSGEVHTLMGENGAGKSTLIKILTGVYPRDSGAVKLEGQSIHPRSTLEAQGLGISTVYQEINLIPTLTVAENISLGREPTLFGQINWRAIRSIAEGAMAKLDVQIDVNQPLSSYSIAIQQMVAIARSVEIEAKVLVLDEPTSSLDTGEAKRLFDVIRRLKADGLGIVFVSHFLDQVFEISDRISVLRNGKLVGCFVAKELSRLQLVSRMIGKEETEVAKMADRKAKTLVPETGVPFLSATGIGRTNSISPLDLSVRKGEIVGVAGLLGSGRTEVAKLLFGIDKHDQGTICVEGKAQRLTNPRRAIRLGFGFLPEDRKAEGILPSLSVRENMMLALQAKRGWLKLLSIREQQQLADRYIKALKIATPDAEKPIGELSGGNQQRVLIARWLAAQPQLLILDEPTRGIDVGAKAEVEGLTLQLCADGMAIVFISSELEEVLRDSHRVVVMRDRKKVGELSGDDLNAQELMNTIAASANGG